MKLILTRKRMVRWVSLLVLIVLLGGTVHEATWRMKNYLDDESPSPNDSLVADIRNMPEGSKLPNGQGVYLRTAFAPLQRYQSQLIFAGHCRLLRADWISDTQLRVGCALREGEPLVLAKESHGVTIDTKIFRR